MISTRAPTDAEAAAWQADWRSRLHAWYGQPGVSAGWVSRQAERQMSALSVHAAFFTGYPIRARQMIKEIPASDASDDFASGLDGRPMTEAEFASWRAGSVRGYAADFTDSGTLPAAEAAVVAEEQFDQLLPDGLRTANHSFLSVIADGEVVATNWVGHHYRSPDSWVFGVETHEGHRGKGYGRAAMILGERSTRAASDSYLGLNVFGHNVVAITMYESMGYRSYDHGRSIEL